MRIRHCLVPALLLALLTLPASAKQRKPHEAGPHPKANHPIFKVKKQKKHKHR